MRVTVDGRVVAGRYRLGRRIGSGAMGIVWEANDEVLGRTVAAKQLRIEPGHEHEAEDAKRRVMREGRIAARLHHPNAVTVFDVVDDGEGLPWLIMEYVPSTSLSQRLALQGWLPPEEAARIGMHMSAALAAAHAKGVVHRDVKPGNVLLGEDGIVKITDFGISRAVGDSTVTATGMLVGTPAFLAPELAKGADPAPASDVFALASTLYTAVEGVPPFGLNENPLALLHKVSVGKIDPPAHTGPLMDLLLAMLAAAPADRPNMSQVHEALTAVASGRPLRLPDGQAAVDPAARTVAMASEPFPPRGGYPTRVEPHPTAPQPRIDLMQPPRVDVGPRPEPARSTGRIAAVIGVAILVGLGTVIWLAGTHSGNGTDANGAGSSGSSQSQAVPPPLPSLTGTPGADDLVHVIQRYVGMLATNPSASWQLLDPALQATLGSEGLWSTQWLKYQSVSVDGLHEAGDYYYLGDVTFVGKDGSKVVQPMGFSLHWDQASLYLDKAEKVGSPRSVG